VDDRPSARGILKDDATNVVMPDSFYVRRGKRTLDLCLAGLLTITLAPVLLGIAAAIRIDGGGSVLFVQTRYGVGGEKFQIYKFRTMTVSEDGAAFRQAVQNDRRVTRVGAFLRRTSLDELPQLINVINGTMSIIGPRPHPTALDDEFAPLIVGYAYRFCVKPGITGLAQVRGQRGPTETTQVMAARVKSDIEYTSRVSLAMDLKILFKTVRVVFGDGHAF
jgi:putative colanic acid biosynthesis UDP-glucose lipid carrier transferase